MSVLQALEGGWQQRRWRVLAALLVLALGVALDQMARAPQAGPARAQPAAALAATALDALRRTDGGTIPMPEGARAAHASNLLAMPPGHPAALTALWFAGDRESAPNVQIAASQFDRARQAWLPARYVVNRQVMGELLGFGLRRLGNPVAWLDPQGRMHVFVVATGWGGWAAARILHLEQDSPGNELAGLRLRPVRVLPLSWLWNTSVLVRNSPLPLADGGMLLPAHFELGIKYPLALRFDARGGFLGLERMSRQKHLLQPALLALDATHWRALLRDERPEGRICVVETRDGGAHWSDAPELALSNPDAAVAALTLGPQSQVLAYNSSPHSRALLDLAGSADGAQWRGLQALAHGGDSDEYSYPALAWADGALWVSYTDHRRSIAWQRFAPVGAGVAP